MSAARIFVLGATSAIAVETIRHFAARGDSLFLAARSDEKLSAVKSDLMTRGAGAVHTRTAELSDPGAHQALVDEAWEKLGGFDVVLLAYGVLGDQRACENGFAAAEEVIRTNFTSAVSLLTVVANRMERARTGTIAVISSVAGDRGRQSNYLYGCAKAGLNAYLQGLRNRLFRSGVKVLTVKPGFVDTPMTAGMRKGPLFAPAATVGEGIYSAIRRGKDEVYLPFFWRFIMLAIKITPECVFKRLRL